MAGVLVAVARADADGEAISEALGLLRADLRVVFLTVFQGAMPVLVTDTAIGAPVVVPTDAWEETDQAARQSATRQMHELLDRFGLHGDIRVESGDPGERICAVALEEDVELIVMGTHHAGVIRRLLGGSVAEDVAEHAPCPVLLVGRRDAAR